MEYKCPDFYALPWLSISHFGVGEGCMRNPPGPTIHLPVIAFNKHNLLWRLIVLVVPPMLPIRQDRAGLSYPVGVDQLDGEDIFVWDGV